jgi:hypothetical protein
MWVLLVEISTQPTESVSVAPVKIINYISDFVSKQLHAEQDNGKIIKMFVKM